MNTNVPGSVATLTLACYGAARDPAPLIGTADESGQIVLRLPEEIPPIRQAWLLVQALGFRSVARPVEPGDEVSVVLEAAVGLSGLVRSGSGGPLPAALVRLDESRFVLTGSDGRFELFLEEPGPIKLEVAHPGHLTAVFDAIAPSRGLVFVLEPGLVVRGSVRFPDGSAAPGTTVTTEDGRHSCRSGIDGRYELSGLEPGTVRVSCFESGRTREVQAGQQGVDFEVDRAAVRIRVVNGAGDPFRGADVSVEERQSDQEEPWLTLETSPESGEILAYLEPGTTKLRVTAAAPMFAARTLDTDVPASGLTEVTLVLRPRGRTGDLEVRAKTPAGEIAVWLYEPGGRALPGYDGLAVKTDETGACRLAGLPVGRYELRISHADRLKDPRSTSLVSVTEVTIESGATSSVAPTLSRGGHIRVTVRDASWQVVAPRELRVYQASGERVQVTFVQLIDRHECGGVVLTAAAPALSGMPLEAGRYRVVSRHGAETIASAEVLVEEGRTIDVNLRALR